MSLVRVDELIHALKGCDRNAVVFISIDEEGNEYKPLDGDLLRGIFSANARDENEWEMVKKYMADRNEKLVILFPIG